MEHFNFVRRFVRVCWLGRLLPRARVRVRVNETIAFLFPDYVDRQCTLFAIDKSASPAAHMHGSRQFTN